MIKSKRCWDFTLPLIEFKINGETLPLKYLTWVDSKSGSIATALSGSIISGIVIIAAGIITVLGLLTWCFKSRRQLSNSINGVHHDTSKLFPQQPNLKKKKGKELYTSTYFGITILQMQNILKFLRDLPVNAVARYDHKIL